MKILIVSDSFPPRPDGIAQATSSLVRGLSCLGHETAVVVPRETAFIDEPQTIRVPVLPFRMANYPIAIAANRSLYKVIDTFKPDIVHIQSLARLGLAGAMLALRRNLPLVLTWHTDVLAYRKAFPQLNLAIPASHLTWHGYSWQALLASARVLVRAVRGADVTDEHARMLTGVVSAFDVVIAPSAKAARSLARHNESGIYAVIVPSAVSPAPEPSPAETNTLRQITHQLRHAKDVIIFVGRPSPEKNLGILLSEISRTVMPICPGTHLIVAGARPGYERRYRKLARALGITEAVHFIGEVPNAVVRHLMTSCSALVMPSHTETQGLVITEAALAGVPSVILDETLEGLVVHETTGLLARSEKELGEAICRLIRDKDLRARLGAAARREAESYTPQAFAAQVVALYDEAFSRHASRIQGDRHIHLQDDK